MAAANSNIQFTGLDFNLVKNNLKTFLRSQDKLKDYDYEGSALSVLLDILAYNTQYNAFYLNQVANEMFLDSAQQRSSVVSHAKTLNYTPRSYIAPTAFVDVVITNVPINYSSLTLPSYTNFLSESIDGVNYNFLTTESSTVNVSANTATFNNIEIKQGLSVNYNFVVDSTSNPTYTFELPDNQIDTSSLKVSVQSSSSNSNYQIYTRADKYLLLDDSSEVYFLQESLNGNYEIIFGNGIIGKKLTDGNIIRVSAIITQGLAAAGANNFALIDTVDGFTNYTVYGKVPASNGNEKESLDSIKFQAPKSYSAQNRAVTKNDYITLLNQNQIGVTFDAVNVWGGEENDPPVYGQIFLSLKPSGAYVLTDTQKQKLITDVIQPISLMTVTPTIVDPDYTYLKLSTNVYYDPTKTNLTASELQTAISNTISRFCASTLNTFNSTFMADDLAYNIKSTSQSIITSETNIQLKKRFYPNLTTPSSYKFFYGTSLKRGVLTSGVSCDPSFKYRNPLNLNETLDSVFLEEVPASTYGVESISIINPGFGYQYAPTVTILGDGTGATATAEINTNGQITNISVTNSGNNYTSALVTITPQFNDNTGQSGAGVALLKGRYGNIRSYYYDYRNVKTVLNSNIGTIDYAQGIITLDNFNPLDVNDPLGALNISSTPVTSIISSSYNRILTVDPFDPAAISVNMIAKQM